MTVYEYCVIDICTKLLKLEGVDSKRLVKNTLQDLLSESAIENTTDSEVIEIVEKEIFKKILEVTS